MKKISLKALKQMRDEINAILPNYLIEQGQKVYITAYGRDIETNEQINAMKRFDYFAQFNETNWSYFLSYGQPIKRGE